MSNEIPVWLKRRCRARNAAERWHVSATDCAVRCLWHALTSGGANGFGLLFQRWNDYSGKRGFEGTCGVVRFNINKSCQNYFFPLRSNFYPLSGGLILQACDKVFWQSIPAVAVISSLCWSLCLSKDGTNAATPNPTSWSAAQSVVSYYTVIQTSHRIWMWLIFSGKLFVSGWLLAAAGYTSSSSSPPATGLHSSSLWLSHYSSIKV